jgi:hypothetical protein
MINRYFYTRYLYIKKEVMSLLNIFRKNETLKGIVLGLLALFILEFGTLAVIAGFSTENILYFENIQYFCLLGFNAIISVLMGIGIAKKWKIVKRITYILSLVIFIMIIAGYAYFVWFRFSHHL